MEGVSGNPRNPPKTPPDIYYITMVGEFALQGLECESILNYMKYHYACLNERFIIGSLLNMFLTYTILT